MRSIVAAACLLATSAFAGQVDQFCMQWIKAARSARSYDDALESTLIALDVENAPGQWGKTLRALAHASPADHVAILRGYAKDAAETFNCEPFEFPAGRPAHKVELDGEAAGGVRAFAVEGGVVFSLREARIDGFDRGVVQRGKKVLTTKLPTLTSPRVLLAPGVVLVAAGSEVWSVPREGGEPKQLAKLDRAVGFTIDGAKLLYASHDVLYALDWAKGGAPVKLAELDSTPWDLEVMAGPSGILVAADRALARVDRQGAVTELAPRGSLAWFDDRGAVVELGARAAAPAPSKKTFRSLADTAKPQPSQPPAALYRIAFDGTGPVKVGPPLDLQSPVGKGGSVWGLEGADWPGKGRVVRVTLEGGALRPVATPIGSTRELQLDGKRVYWHDARFGAIYSAAAD